MEACRGSIPPLRRCVACCVAVVGWCAYLSTCSCSCGNKGHGALTQHQRAGVQLLSAPSMVMSWCTWWQARAGLLSSGTSNAAIFVRICAAAAATHSEITSACYGPCPCTNAAWQRYCSGMPGWVRLVLGHDFNSWAVETRRGSIPPLRRCVACFVAVVGWRAYSTTCPCSCGSCSNQF